MSELYAIKVPPTLPPDVFEKLLSYLDELAQARIRKFRLEADAIRCLFGRISIIYYLLSTGRLTTDSLPELKFGEEGNGKPIIVEPPLTPRVEYNISHDGEYVVLAVSGRKVGVDVMKIPPNPADIEEALTDQMTVQERQGIAVTLSPRQRSERMTTLWCVKEAYVKAIGEGVGFGMERVEVDLALDGALQEVKVDGRPSEATGWNVEIGILAGDYIWVHVGEVGYR